eukprot:gb/GEZN01009232.1/.p1 GENE.gb/GEZN01009232.1/~~gb/GEZN01009232.1/.p1  ORF type:complete len:409 (+),score=64.61 gb/GEZN01009232.1/:91-1317(+)
MGQVESSDATVGAVGRLPTCSGRGKSVPYPSLLDDSASSPSKKISSPRQHSSNRNGTNRKFANGQGANNSDMNGADGQKIAKLVREPSETSASESDSSSESQALPVRLRRNPVTETRDQKWNRMMAKWKAEPDYLEVHSEKIKWRIRRGIPPAARGEAWALLSGARQRQQANPHLYAKLKSAQPHPRDIEQLDKDFPRFNVTSERQRENVRDILTAICVFEPKLGYVQGMDSTCSMALQYMSPEMVFWLMERLLWDKKYALSGLYSPGMPLAHRMVFIHERLVALFAPKLYKYMQQQRLEHISYAFRWLTMRFSNFSFPLASRATDMFLMEGVKAIFRLAISILLSLEAELLLLDGEAMMVFLRDLASSPVAQDVDALVERALGLPVTVKLLNDLAKTYDSQQDSQHK